MYGVKIIQSSMIHLDLVNNVVTGEDSHLKSLMARVQTQNWIKCFKNL